MRPLLLIGLLTGLGANAYTQGWVDLQNLSNVSTDPFATASGLFWVSTGGTPALINQDFNAVFYGGSDSANLALIDTFLLSNGTAALDNIGGPGTFNNPSGKLYPIAGTTVSAFMMIQAWTGNFNSYAAALAGGALAAQSPVFINPVSVPPGFPQPLYGMPAMVLAIPEPSTVVLAGLGGLLMLWLWRRNNIQKANP